MYKLGKLKKSGVKKGTGKQKTLKSQSLDGRDIIKREEQFRIAPKHPGMGRR